MDFKIARCQTQDELMRLLATDDSIETLLRALAAFIHHRRTGDFEASNHMLAIRAPGTMVDIAPTWLVTEASVHSKLEYMRRDRCHAGGKASGKTSSKSTSIEKPAGKAKGGKRGSASAQPKADP